MSAPVANKKRGRPKGKATAHLRMLEREGRKPQWVIYDASDSKKPLQVFTGTADKTSAEKLFFEYMKKKNAEGGKVKLAQDMTIRDIITSFWDLSDEDPSTIRFKDLYEADKVLLTFWGDKKISQITKSACHDYMHHRAGMASGTDRRELKRLKTLEKWHCERNGIGAVSTWWLPPKSPPRSEWFTRREAARLICAARGRTWNETAGDWERTADGLLKLRPAEHQMTRVLIRLILLGVFTGTRGDAMVRTRWRHARRDDQPSVEVQGVRPKYNRRGPAERGSRTKRRPVARLCKELVRLMRRWEAADVLRGCAHVITKYAVVERVRIVVKVRIINGKHVYEAALMSVRDAVPTNEPFTDEVQAGRVFRALRQHAGLPKAVIHALRHTCATWLLEYAPIEDVARFLGLTVQEVEATYAKYDLAFTAPAARALNEWGRPKRPTPSGKGAFPKAA